MRFCLCLVGYFSNKMSNLLVFLTMSKNVQKCPKNVRFFLRLIWFDFFCFFFKKKVVIHFLSTFYPFWINLSILSKNVQNWTTFFLLKKNEKKKFTVTKKNNNFIKPNHNALNHFFHFFLKKKFFVKISKWTKKRCPFWNFLGQFFFFIFSPSFFEEFWMWSRPFFRIWI